MTGTPPVIFYPTHAYLPEGTMPISRQIILTLACLVFAPVTGQAEPAADHPGPPPTDHLHLSPALLDLLKQEMNAIQQGMQQLIPAIAAGNWQNATDIGTRIQHSYIMQQQLTAAQGEELHRATDARERRPAKSFAGQRVHAVAGIGDPGRFFRHLAALGVQAVPHPFPDHHPFRPADLDFGDDAPVLMTEKDAVKCKRFARPTHWILPVRAVPDPAFDAWLQRRLGELGHRSKAA